MIADSISMRLSGGEGVHRCEYKTLVFKVKNFLRSCEKRGSRKWRRTRLKRTIPGKSRQGLRPSITNLFFFLFLFSIVAVADGQRMFTAGDSEFSLWQFEMLEHIFLRIFTLTLKCLHIFPATLEEQLFSGSKESTSTPSLKPMVRSFRYFLKISFEIKANAEGQFHAKKTRFEVTTLKTSFLGPNLLVRPHVVH